MEQEYIDERVAGMSPAELQDYVDLSDVIYSEDSQFLANWREMVADEIIFGLEQGRSWAFDFMEGK